MLVPDMNRVDSGRHVANCETISLIGYSKIGRINSKNHRGHLRMNGAEEVSDAGVVEFESFAPVGGANNGMKKMAIGEGKRLMHPAITIAEFDSAPYRDYKQVRLEQFIVLRDA